MIKQQWSMYLSIGIALLSFGQTGIVTGWPSPVLHRLEGPNSPIPLSSAEGGWIASIMAIAAFVSTPLPAILMHYKGRRISILMATIPYFIFWIIMCFATTSIELLIARAIAGIGQASMYIIIPVYLGEISPDKIRGGVGIGMNVIGNIGILWIYWIGTYPEMWVVSITCILPLFVIISLYKWLPESPYYLLQNNRELESIDILKKITSSNKISDEINKIKSTINAQTSENSIKELFSEISHRRALLICMGTITFAQLTGGITFLHYAHIIFQKAGNVSANTMSLIKASSQVLTSIVAAYVVDIIGRKPLLIFSCIGSSVFMSSEGIYFYLLDNNYIVDNIWWLPLVSMILFNICQVIGLTSISVAYLGELFHPKVKPVAVCLSKAYMVMLIAIVSKLYQVISDELGNSVPFFIFAFVGVVGVFFVIFYVPETKGKSLEEIQYYMKNKTYNKI